MTDTQRIKRPGLARIIWGALLLAYGLIALIMLPGTLATTSGPGVAGAMVGTFGGLIAGILLLVFGILARRR